MKSVMVFKYCRSMKLMALARARWEKKNGPGWRHKRIRAIKEAIYFREKMKVFK